MSAIQLSFSLRTTANVKQVHLIGSWDGYQGQLPLSKDSGSKWKGVFRFQPSLMKAGQRYWFYYMLDGYQVSHDPSKEHTVEPTTGRKLNVLDVPTNGSTRPSSKESSNNASKRSSRRMSRELPRGRPADEIRSPKPVRPGQVARKLEAQVTTQTKIDQLAARLRHSRLADYSEDSDIDDSDSDADSDVPSLSSGGSSVSGCSSPSSLSSTSSNCTCERYAITRGGQRVRIDCGGARCKSDDEESEVSSEEEEYKHRVRASRRHGMVMR